MSAIKVQGETYTDWAELVDTIGQLEARYLTMPEGQARADLLTHIERLKEALDGDTRAQFPSAADRPHPAESATARPHPAVSAAEDTDDDEPENEGALPVCPMCMGEGVLAVEPPQNPQTRRCDDCNGFGIVYSGSRREGREVDDCPTCQGDGFVKITPAVQAPPAPIANHAPVAEWSAATLAPDGSGWLPPEPGTPPWEGATWDRFYGRWA